MDPGRDLDPADRPRGARVADDDPVESLPTVMSRKLGHILEALGSYRAERIYVFGSHARGEEDELSDLDLVIIKQTAQPLWARLREMGRFLPPEVGGVDVMVYTPEEFSEMLAQGNAFAEMIVEEGRLLYERQAES